MYEQPVALVTGASRGIGRAIAFELGRLEHAVVVNYVSSREGAAEVVAAIRERGGAAIAAQGDVGSTTDRDSIVAATLNQFGRIDVLVNNAGITSPGRLDLLDATEAGWDRVFDTNLKGPFFLAQRVAKEMISLHSTGKTAGGKIINISSISAYAMSTNRADYCLTKSALHTMTELLAVRLADEGIGVYEVCPGIIDSDMTAPVREKYDRLIAEGLSPQRRWGQPEDVARAVAAIVEGYLPFSTGQQIHVDGGFHIRRL
jgi:NAD(P)-dependent dehydrogenase (short-subunit alcohol dehydrogenase family)